MWHVHLGKVLNKAIESFTEHWNGNCKPIKRTATAKEILGKVHAITSHMEALLGATDINDVAHQAA